MAVLYVIIILLGFLSGCVASNITISKKDMELRYGEAGFLFTIPQRLISGRKQMVCLTIHGATPPSRIKVDIKYKDIHHYTEKIVELEYSCFHVKVPVHNKNTPQYVSVKVQVQLDGLIYGSHNQDPVLVYPDKKRTFIGLDRTMYKPGDKIRMRILVLEDDLLPPEQYKIPDVRIRNPLDISVAVWENISTTAGLVQLEHSIYKDAKPGKWKVEVNDEVKHFEVSKYVLPRFNINISHPKAIYYASRFLELKICSKYNFEEEVKGKAFVKVTDTGGNMKPVYEIQQMTNGCAKFKLKNSQLNLMDIKRKYPMYDPKLQLSVTATVIEYGTDKIVLDNVKIPIDLKEYHMKIVSENVFQPGLPYHGKVQYSNVHTDLRNHVVEICYNVAIKKSWNYLNNEKCRNFTLNGENSTYFSILPLKNTVVHMKITARSLNHTLIGDSLLVVRIYSSLNDYILLRPNVALSKQCGPTQQILVIYTTDRLIDSENVTFYSVIKSRGELYSVNKITKKIQSKTLNYKNELKNIIGTPHRYNTDGSSIDKFVLRFNLDSKIIGKYQILLFYIGSNGETVTATREIDRGPCFRNKVQASWSDSKIFPGSKTILNIKTTTPSFCAVTAVDSSVEFMGASDNLNAYSLMRRLHQEPPSPASNRKSCVSQSKKTIQVPSFYTDPTGDTEWPSRKRRKRYVYPFSEDFDAYDTFTKFGAVVISNLKVVTKPCYTGPKVSLYSPAPFQTDNYDLQSEDNVVAVRKYFPETWLWELTPVRSFKQLPAEIPHSITKWKTNVLCVSPTEGIGMASPLDISSFQPLFINILTPYSIKRGEILHLRILIFNYKPHSLPIKINIGTSNGMKLLSSKNSASYCILPSDTITHVFPLTGNEVGEATITVVAEVDALFPGHCGPETLLNTRDIVVRHLIVEPEGYPVETTKSALICNSDLYTSSNISWKISVPDNVVPNTAKARLSLNADLLGKSLENLEDLLQIPNGCGEQIMATMAPNLFLVKYLKSINKLETPIRQKAVKNMKIGYHKILNYGLKDGSFSPFGYHDSFGSMFLTAFVVKTLKLAKDYIYVDQRVIDRAVSWIFSHQLENGCFDTMLHVFQDMGATSTENSTSALSSYVIVSLLDSGIDVPKNVIENAKYCIRGYSDPDKYTLAISCYALFKMKWYDEANKVLKRLLNVASKQNNMLWWSMKDSGSLTTDIEVTSYVLLTLLEYNTNENLAHAHSIVRWLTSKVGPYGGFKSTQDTVVALDALSKYAIAISSKKINLDIQLQAERQDLNYQIHDDDRLKTKKITLKATNNEINVRIRGEGCLLVQSVLSYYLKNVPKSESFKIALEVSPVSTVAKCSIATLSPCVSYSGPDKHSNMAVLDVALPSGYIADRASLYKLTEAEDDSKVKMFEEINDRVIFYFTKLDQEMRCFSFGINEDTFVEGRADSVVKLYDYYKPEYENIELYTIQHCNDSSEQESTTAITATEYKTESQTPTVLSIWDYIDNSSYENETTSTDFETTTYTMKLEDYV